MLALLGQRGRFGSEALAQFLDLGAFLVEGRVVPLLRVAGGRVHQRRPRVARHRLVVRERHVGAVEERPPVLLVDSARAQRLGEVLARQVEDLRGHGAVRGGILARRVFRAPLGPVQIEVRIPVGVLQHVGVDVERARRLAPDQRTARLQQRIDEVRSCDDARRAFGQLVHAGAELVAANAEPLRDLAHEGRQLRRQIVAVAAGLALVLGHRHRQLAAVVGLAEPSQARQGRIGVLPHGIQVEFGVRRHFEAYVAQHGARRRTAAQGLAGVQHERGAGGYALGVGRAKIGVEGELRRRRVLAGPQQNDREQGADHQHQQRHDEQAPWLAARRRCRTFSLGHARCPSTTMGGNHATAQRVAQAPAARQRRRPRRPNRDQCPSKGRCGARTWVGRWTSSWRRRRGSRSRWRALRCRPTRGSAGGAASGCSTTSRRAACADCSRRRCAATHPTAHRRGRD